VNLFRLYFSLQATIIGYRSKKVLFVGIRNRYCSICQRSSSRKEEKPPHNCFLNWTKSSTAMEADGVLEGFLMYEIDVQLCGLMIDPDIPYLAASPGE